MSIGIWQIVLILVIVLLLFGAGKLPRIMGDFAKGIKSFKAGIKDGEAPPQSTAAQATQPDSQSTVTKSIQEEAPTVDRGAVNKDEAAKT